MLSESSNYTLKRAAMRRPPAKAPKLELRRPAAPVGLGPPSVVVVSSPPLPPSPVVVGVVSVGTGIVSLPVVMEVVMVGSSSVVGIDREVGTSGTVLVGGHSGLSVGAPVGSSEGSSVGCSVGSSVDDSVSGGGSTVVSGGGWVVVSGGGSTVVSGGGAEVVVGVSGTVAVVEVVTVGSGSF